MAVIDNELKDFIESEVGILFGSRDAGLSPEVTHAWGARVLEGGNEVELFVDRDAGARTVANLKANRLVAATFASPITYRSVQLKGWCLAIEEPAAADAPWIERHREAFAESLRARGLASHVSRTLWSKDVVRVRFQIDESFDQTPGPGAGKKL
jgi:hypothetical protein